MISSPVWPRACRGAQQCGASRDLWWCEKIQPCCGDAMIPATAGTWRDKTPAKQGKHLRQHQTCACVSVSKTERLEQLERLGWD